MMHVCESCRSGVLGNGSSESLHTMDGVSRQKSWRKSTNMLTFDDAERIYRIGELARELDRSTLTIKKWEAIGVIPEAKRDSRGWRYYTRDDINEIKSGIKIQPLTRDIANALNFRGTGGVVISEIESGSPGEKGGFKKGDIIAGINGFNVTTVENVQSIFRGAFPGEVYELEIFRDDAYLDLILKLE